MKTKLVYLFSVLLIGSLAWAAASDFNIGGILTVTNTGLHILDTNATHDLIIKPGSDLSTDRIFTVTTGDAARTLTMSGDATLPDPRVGTVTNTKWCVGDVSGYIQCATNAPVLVEDDPQVGTLTNTKWCTTDGTDIDCASDAPALTPWTSTIDAGNYDLDDGGTFEVDGLLSTTDNTLDVALAAGEINIEVDDDDTTGVDLVLFHDSASPSDGDVIGRIQFDANDSTSASMTYAQITGEIQHEDNGPPASEEAIVRMSVVEGAGSLTEYLRLDGTDGITSIVASRSIDMSGMDTTNPDDSWQSTLAADTLPRSTARVAQHAWAQATTAANYVGANQILAGGIGAKKTVFVAAGSGTKTVTITHNAAQVGTASTATVYTADAGGWTCSTVTNAECACNLYAVIIAAPVSGWTVQRSNETCTDATLFWQPDPLTHALSISSQAPFTDTSRNDGQTFVTPGTSTLPGISTVGDANTGFSLPGGDLVRVIVAGAAHSYFSASGMALNTGDFICQASGYYTTSGRGGWANTADGKTVWKNNGNTSNVCYDYSTDATVSLYDGDCSGAATLIVNGANQLEGRVAQVAAVDMASLDRQTLFTVPAGKTFYPRKVCVGPCSAVIDAATGGFGSDTPAQDFYAATIQTHAAAASEACWFPAVGTAVPSIAAAGTFAFDATIAEGAGDTCTMSVYGELR